MKWIPKVYELVYANDLTEKHFAKHGYKFEFYDSSYSGAFYDKKTGDLCCKVVSYVKYGDLVGDDLERMVQTWCLLFPEYMAEKLQDFNFTHFARKTRVETIKGGYKWENEEVFFESDYFLAEQMADGNLIITEKEILGKLPNFS